MKITDNKMKYSKLFLDELRRRVLETKNASDPQFTEVIRTFRLMIKNMTKLTLSEEYFICGCENNSLHSNPEDIIEVSSDAICKNYWFRDRYLLYAIAEDLNGHGVIKDMFWEIDGSVIDEEQKKKDVDFLNNEYQAVLAILNSKRQTKDHLTNFLLSELNYHLDFLSKYCKNANIGYLKHEYRKKEIVLHGKYLLLIVKQYYEELGSNREIIDLFGTKLIIDAYCYIHILSRHFAEKINDHLPGKTFHFDKSLLNYEEIPYTLRNIVEEYKNNAPPNVFNKKSIHFLYNGKPYSIYFSDPYFQTIKGGVKNEYLTLKTFYPVGLQKEIDELNQLKALKINDFLTFLI